MFIFAGISVLIWILIFLGGLIFRRRKLPYLLYLIIASMLGWLIFDSYGTPAHHGEAMLLMGMLGFSAMLGLVLLLIGEVSFDQMDYPFGKPEKDE